MKRILFTLFILFVFTAPAFSVITTEETSSQEYLESHGYSSEMARLINLQNAQINGCKSKYISNEPDWYSIKPIYYIRQLFMYIDPGLDNGKFMQENIEYTNKWDDL